MRNILVVLSGPSGVGKGTVAKILVKKRKDVALSVSCTTRVPRIGETDGKEYFFIKRDAFEKKIEDGGFLEYSEHFGNYYGTPRDFVTEKLKKENVLLEIDVNGGLKVKENYPDAVLIMMTSSLPEIKRRLEKRGTETEEQIDLRMQRIGYELEQAKKYDYTVENGELEKAVSDIEKIIDAEREKE